MFIIVVIVASVKNNSSTAIIKPDNTQFLKMSSRASNDDVELVCSKCGTVATPEAKYCKRCGDKFE